MMFGIVIVDFAKVFVSMVKSMGIRSFGVIYMVRRSCHFLQHAKSMMKSKKKEWRGMWND